MRLPRRQCFPRPAGRSLRAAAAASVLVAAMAGCASEASGSRADGDTRYVAGDGSTVLLAAADRVSAPALSGTTLDGRPFDLATQRGKVVVLNVWASWCAPCRAEASALARTAQKLSGQDVVFVGLNTRDSDAAAKAFVGRFGLPYPSVVDADGRLQLLFRDSLPPSAIPSTLVIDRDGRVAARALGEVDESRIRGLVEPLLREKVGA